MNKMILAAVAVMSLGMGTAFAEGGFGGAEPTQYGSQAFPNQAYHDKTVFSEIFGHRNHTRVDAPRTAEGRTINAGG